MQERAQGARSAPPIERGAINWRYARAKIAHERYMSLRRIRHENGPTSDLWDKDEDELRAMAHDHAVRSCQAAIRSAAEKY